MEDKPDPALLQHARLYGLIGDHLTLEAFPKDSSDKETYMASFPPFPAASTDTNFEDDEPLAELEPLYQAQRGFTKPEKLALRRDAAALLSSVIRPPSQDDEEADATEADLLLSNVRKKVEDAKIELPLLKTDDELDMRGHGLVRLEPGLNELESLSDKDGDDDTKGSLFWPEAGQWARFEHDAKTEKLALSRDAIAVLQTCLKDVLKDGNGEEMLEEEEFMPTRSKAREDCTPPLSPRRAPMHPYTSSSPLEDLELLPDTVDYTKDELDRVGNGMLEASRIKDTPTDSVERSSDSPGQEQSSHSAESRNSFSSSQGPKALSHHHEVNSPMTPTTSPERRPRGSSEQDLLPAPGYDTLNAEIEEDEQHIEDFLENNIQPLAEQATRASDQEQLQETASTKRIHVPVMDFSTPAPPWECPADLAMDERTSQREGPSWLQNHTQEKMQAIKTGYPKWMVWPGGSRLDRRLTWTPFPIKLGRAVPTEIGLEEAEGGVAAKQILESLALEKDADAADDEDGDVYVCKPEGLRILDEVRYPAERVDQDGEQEEEHEIEPARPRDEAQLQSTSRKRHWTAGVSSPTPQKKKTRLVHEESERNISRDRGVDLHKAQSSTEPVAINTIPGQTEPDGPTAFNTADALRNFMKTRAHTLKKARSSQYFLPAFSTISTSGSTPIGQGQGQLQGQLQGQGQGQGGNGQEERNDIEKWEQQQRQERPRSSASHPVLDVPFTPRPFVISTALLSQRRLMRRLRQLYPSAAYIERDFTTPNSALPSPSKSSLSVVQASHTGAKGEADEADLIVSPGVGVIWTTLQMRQRALPGQRQTQPGPFKKRIVRIQKRYETLIVLVCGGDGGFVGGDPFQDGIGLDEKDRQVLAELESFVAGLRGARIVINPIGGEEEDLARWIVRSKIDYSAGTEGLKLFQEETRCELFLRRAGLNAFAAQAVLSRFSSEMEGSGIDEHQRAEAGLVKFLNMPRTQRFAMFEGLFGGRRLLDEVSEVIDASSGSPGDTIRPFRYER